MMSPTMKISKSEIESSLPYPKKGEIVNGRAVLSTKVMEKDNGVCAIEIVFEKGTKQKEIPSLLQNLFAAHTITTKSGDYIIRNRDFQIKPKDGKVAVLTAMHIIPAVRENPSQKLTPLQDFDQHYSEMKMANPTTFFRTFDCRATSGPSFRNLLWSKVSLMGESYGYHCDGVLYHRRASLIMPKIMITKAVDGAKTFYHTHPSKDEPSFSSPDDFNLYFDLCFEPSNVRHFYTVMADRIDYFHIVPKKDSKNRYVKIDQDKLIDEIEAKMQELEKKHTSKFGDSYEEELKFNETVTRDLVKWMNKKYGSYVTVKYKCYYKARKNPPEGNAKDLHLGDEFIAKAMKDLTDRNHEWPEFESEKLPQHNYTYWFMETHLGKEINGSDTARMGFSPGMGRYLRHYLAQSVYGNFNRRDLLRFFLLHYDIMINDQAISDDPSLKQRVYELAEELGVSSEVADIIILLEEVRGMDPDSEEAKTIADMYYPILLLANFAITCLSLMKQVQEEKITLEKAKHTHFDPIKIKLIEDLKDPLVEYRKSVNGVMLDEQGGTKRAHQPYLNPPPELTHGSYKASISPYYYAPVLDLLEELLSEFTPPDKEIFSGKKFSLRVPVEGFEGKYGNLVSVGFSPSSGILDWQMVKSTPELSSEEVALKSYIKIIDVLNEKGLEIPEDYEITATPMSNPSISGKVITITGPSGSGKTTILKYLLKNLPNSKLVKSYTTRKPRPRDPGDKVYVSKEEFKQMIANNDFIEYRSLKGGYYYGRRLEDFEDADYYLIDVNPKGLSTYNELFSNTFNIGIYPKESPKEIYDRLISRGGMSPQDARRRTNIIPKYIEDMKKKKFDTLIETQKGKFDDAAKKILGEIPLVNPAVYPLTYFNAHLYASGSEDPFFPGDVPVAPPDLLKGNPERKSKPVTLEQFTKWVQLVNMKNKELEAFLDSDLGEQAGLNKKQQEEFGGINRGRTSGFAILRMRKKLGLTGPKDYIKNGPMVIKRYYEMALEKWNPTDWYWCGRQYSFNSRARGQSGPYTDKKGRPTRKLLSLWVWGHDPWRYARKIEGKEKMPPCPDVPWVGMTEKRKYGKTEFVYKNPMAPGYPARKAGLFTGKDGRTFLLLHDQAWAQLPSGKWIEVDVMMKPLLEEMWRRGIDTRFSDTGGNLEPYPFDADEARKKALNAIPMGEYALEEKWKDFESQTGDLGTEGYIDDKAGYLSFGNPVPPESPKEFISDANTLRWGAAKDYANLRRLYAAFNVPFPKAKKNPMAPGYQSYGWTTQDWRAIKVNNKGDIDYSEKCGAEGTRTASGKPRLCLPKKVIQTLLRTESGKEVIREQARKKARAKKGERVPWHPRIKKLHAKLEKETPKDNPMSLVCPKHGSVSPEHWGKDSQGSLICKLCGNHLKGRRVDENLKVIENPPKIITVDYVRDHPEVLFVFGDNDKRTGKGGQAKIRDEPNAIGFRTKHKPSTASDAFYSDTNYKDNIRKMQEDLDTISAAQGSYESVYFIPGIGEGRAKLKEKAPKTYEWMKINLPLSNVPLFVHPDKTEKWSERYEKITKMSGQELFDLANKMAEEKGLEIELIISRSNDDGGYFNRVTKRRKNFPLPPKYEKLYRDWVESRMGVRIELYRGKTLVDRLEFSLIDNKPTELAEYIENKKLKGNKSRNLPLVARYTISPNGKYRLRLNSWFRLALEQNKKRFPFAVGGAGGYEMSEGQTGKGYYGIIKTFQAGLLEMMGWEQFGGGESPMRSDLYQSYGWLTAYSYKANAHYGSRAAEYWLNLHGVTKRPNKEALYLELYRPVYTRKNPGELGYAHAKPSLDDLFPGAAKVAPYYMRSQTIPITALQNGGEWRHGNFAEEDPFSDYFE